jgi:hypothetical protein
VRALDRDHVRGLLDHADDLWVAPLVSADPAGRSIGQVEAGGAQANPLLDLLDRLGQREGFLVGGAQQVKGQPLGAAPADPGQLGQLGDQALDGWGVDGQGRIL